MAMRPVVGEIVLGCWGRVGRVLRAGGQQHRDPRSDLRDVGRVVGVSLVESRDLTDRREYERRRARDVQDVLHDAGFERVERLAVLAGLEELEVVDVARLRVEAAARCGRRGLACADVGLDHRGHVVILARVAGDDQAAGAVADDHDLVAAAVRAVAWLRAVRPGGQRVAAGFDLLDDLVEDLALDCCGERPAAAGGVVALGEAEQVIGDDHVAGAGERAGRRPTAREIPVLGR